MKSHGMYKTRLYNIWRKMRQRCRDPKENGYENYGGRGIVVCKEWYENFQTFYEWAQANGYSDELTIDRINSDGNYEPTNCRWATMKEQQNNKRNTPYIELGGVRKTVSEWAEEAGVSVQTIVRRFKNYGDRKDLVLKSGKVQKSKHGAIYINGEWGTVSSWAKEAGISRQAMHRRVKEGWTGAELLKPIK